jgi:hypothetical protein
VAEFPVNPVLLNCPTVAALHTTFITPSDAQEIPVSCDVSELNANPLSASNILLEKVLTPPIVWFPVV